MTVNSGFHNGRKIATTTIRLQAFARFSIFFKILNKNEPTPRGLPDFLISLLQELKCIFLCYVEDE